ncbi:hypothetical protein AVEN_159176-1, partial [Araneus ventricosus]
VFEALSPCPESINDLKAHITAAIAAMVDIQGVHTYRSPIANF